MAQPVEFRWANERPVAGMPTPEALEREGWRKIRRHPWYDASWLMARPAPEEVD